MEKKYKYSDWIKGNVCLLYTKNYFKGEMPHLLSFDNFDEKSSLKIKQKQKLIFEDEIKKELNKLVKHFSKRYNAINNKQKLNEKRKLINNELKSLSIILNNPINEDIIKFNYLSIEMFELQEIKNYYNRRLIEGKDAEVYFIHSPKSKYKNPTGDSIIEVKAFALWRFKEWLSSLSKICDQIEILRSNKIVD